MAKVLTRLQPQRDPRPDGSAEKSASGPERACGRIVVGVDDSPGGLAALCWALSQARSTGAQLLTVRCWALGLPRHGGRRHLAPSRPHVVLCFDGMEQREASADLVRRSLWLVAGGSPADVTVTVETPEGDPAVTLTGIVTTMDDLLVVGRERSHAIRRVLRGSVSRYCCSHARCPVVVVPTRQPRTGAGGS